MRHSAAAYLSKRIRADLNAWRNGGLSGPGLGVRTKIPARMRLRSGDTFNVMMDRIEALTAEVRKKRKREAQQDSWASQIEPHFSIIPLLLSSMWLTAGW